MGQVKQLQPSFHHPFACQLWRNFDQPLNLKDYSVQLFSSSWLANKFHPQFTSIHICITNPTQKVSCD